jgi:hypothetical protein
MQMDNAKKGMQIAGATIAWLSVIVQFILMINNRNASVPETVIRFFSFFTILTNILVAFSFTSLTGMFGEKWKAFFSKANSFTAVTVYIVVVGIVYNVILRWLQNFTGLQMLVDESLHLIIPLYVLLYWLLFVSPETLEWKAAFKWMLYPLIYCIYVLIRGSFSDFYPYPFMNVNELGYNKVFVNCIYVTLAFFAVSLLLIGVSKLYKKRKTL